MRPESRARAPRLPCRARLGYAPPRRIVGDTRVGARGTAGGPRNLARQSFTYRLASISEEAIGPADRMFKQRFGMHVHEIRVLRLIDDQPGVTFTRLAAQTRIERTATSRIVSRLIAGGYVKRKSDARDARQYQLTATAKAKALREEADPLTRDIEALVLSALDARERRQLLEMLDRLGEWLNTGFAEALAQRYPEFIPPAGAARGGKGD